MRNAQSETHIGDNFTLAVQWISGLITIATGVFQFVLNIFAFYFFYMFYLRDK
jgi:hypothetical protein